jgi:hypothetical protein
LRGKIGARREAEGERGFARRDNDAKRRSRLKKK